MEAGITNQVGRLKTWLVDGTEVDSGWLATDGLMAFMDGVGKWCK
jgi:hypothetical protein